MIVIHSYKSTWPKDFEVIKTSLLSLLGPLALSIDHIGATSVPGLGAKDVIDIQITVESLTPKVPEKLVAAGYHYHSAITHDHVPFGADNTSQLWENSCFTNHRNNVGPIFM